MLTARKTDLVLQAIIIVICACSWVVEETRIIGAVGHMLLGAWQVISALFNTYGMSQGQFRQRIIGYWIVTIIVLVAFAIQPSLMAVAMIMGGVIAIYYWLTYRSFIVYLSHREELATVVRHS